MIEFKLVNKERLRNEWNELVSKNNRLSVLIKDLSVWVFQQYKKDIVITQIYRRQAEQEAIYGSGTKKKSPHQFFNAVDIRSKTFTEEEIDAIENYLNSKWNSTNYYKWTAQCHQVSDFGWHFHIQYTIGVV